MVRLPKELLKKLEFGNPEQIKAYKKWKEDNAAERNPKILKDYIVSLEVTIEDEHHIQAHSKEEAEDIIADMDLSEIVSIDRVSVEYNGIAEKKEKSKEDNHPTLF